MKVKKPTAWRGVVVKCVNIDERGGVIPVLNDLPRAWIGKRVADAQWRHLLVGADHFRFQFDDVDVLDGCRHFLDHAAATQSYHQQFTGLGSGQSGQRRHPGLDIARGDAAGQIDRCLRQPVIAQQEFISRAQSDDGRASAHTVVEYFTRAVDAQGRVAQQ